MTNLPLIQFKNLFEVDPTGQKVWRHYLGEKTFLELTPRYSRMGKNGALATAHAALSDKNPPQLHTHNSIGERVDTIEYHPSYQELQKLSYGAEIVSLKYEPAFLKKYKNNRHLIGFSIAYYFAQTETGLFCPICMTDALGRVLERHNSHPSAQKALKHIASSDLEVFWSGAMFLTEKQGGSDVGANTVQAEEKSGRWFLTGDKWFCSNADAHAALVLARMPGEAGALKQGTRGLGLFLVLRDDPKDNHKTWLTHRLKDKLGVKTMASGEITFQKTEAFLIGGAGEGFKIMTEMVNMSRLYNAVSSNAIARRAVLEAASFGSQRKAFGQKLSELPLWRACLADLTAEHLANLFLVFEATHQMDQGDNGNSQAAQLARLMTPLSKALAGKLSVFAASEAMELIGGNAYIEDHILPRLLRDAQVLPIWEGTTNIQSLDLIRALQKEGSDVFFNFCAEALQKGQIDTSSKNEIQKRLNELKMLIDKLSKITKEEMQRSSREVLEKMGRALSLCLMTQATQDESLKPICIAAIQRICAREAITSPLGGSSAQQLVASESVLLDSIQTEESVN
jgi:acyl-CoA dehydrogenase